MDFLRQWIGILLVLAGLARAGILVLHEPVAGYANRVDMNYTSACIGLFPAKEGTAGIGTPDAPLSTYKIASRTEGCYQGSEVMIAATAVAIARATGVNPERVPLHWIGYTKLALLFVTAFAIAWLLRDHPAASAAHGLVVLLVLADPVVTLWMNTLYTEFAAIWSIYLVAGAAVVLALYDRFSLLAWILLLVGLVVLAFSREQFALLPVLMMLAAWPWLWHASQRMTIFVFLLAAIASAASLWVVPRPLELQKQYRAQAYLGLLLPASSSPARGVEIAGLPAECVPVVGAGWPQQRAQIEKSCPFVYSMSRFSVLRFVADEPHALLRASAHALPSAHGVAPAKLGTMAEAPGKTIDDMPWWGFSPLRLADMQLTPAAVAMSSLAAFVVAPLALVALLVLRRWRGDPLAPLLVGLLLGGTAIYSFLTTVFGGGAGNGRPDIVGTLCAYALVVAAIAGLPLLLLRWKQAPREALLELGVGGVVLLAGAYCAFAGASWIASQPAPEAAAPPPAVPAQAPTPTPVAPPVQAPEAPPAAKPAT